MSNGIDKSTIRSKEQFDATKLAEKYGSAWLIPEDKQNSPIVNNEFNLVVIRYNVFEKPNRKMYIIHTRRKVRMEDMTPEECHEVFQARHWVHQQEGNIGGGDIHRWGPKKYCASSLSDDHYFESLVIPDGTGPVKETLCKDQSPEEVARRKERAKNFK